MTQPLPADLQQRILAQLAGGGFASEEEVMREAINSLEQRQKSLDRWRQMVREADDDVAAGRVGPFDRDAIKRDVRAKLAERGVTD